MVGQFRHVPLHLRARRDRVIQRDYARFYGSYRATTGQTRRFSFQVKVSRRLSARDKMKLIRTVCLNIKDRELPAHKMGQTFDSFKELLRRTAWFRVRRILNYQAGMRYVR